MRLEHGRLTAMAYSTTTFGEVILVLPNGEIETDSQSPEMARLGFVPCGLLLAFRLASSLYRMEKSKCFLQHGVSLFNEHCISVPLTLRPTSELLAVHGAVPHAAHAFDEELMYVFEGRRLLRSPLHRFTHQLSGWVTDQGLRNSGRDNVLEEVGA
ncbi:hypothetical protein MPL1032_240021 [Mesorhizobium plurifarium]|uniref:Uncharacterized protein n=1 Tax=Mesorhizobium plurifarium TaxID=69974 RepID=A0A0K2W0S6_MESPL|nr:hypothetical protein MPL1032_240021 [Mesorhizobium plurifarium]